MHERPSHYPHSPNTQENCLGITSHAEALQRAANIGKPIQQPGTADSNPTPDTRAPPDSPLRGASWRAGRRGVGRRHMVGRAMAAHSKPTTRTPPALHP